MEKIPAANSAGALCQAITSHSAWPTKMGFVAAFRESRELEDLLPATISARRQDCTSSPS